MTYSLLNYPSGAQKNSQRFRVYARKGYIPTSTRCRGEQRHRHIQCFGYFDGRLLKCWRTSFFSQHRERRTCVTTYQKMIGDTDFRNDLIWATVSNTHAFSSAHVDDEGFATATNTLVGGKLWAIETHKSPAKNMTSIHAFDHCQPGNFDTKQVRYKIMYLPPRCVL